MPPWTLIDKKLYVQLGPSLTSRADLTALQRSLDLPERARVVPSRDLHLSIIHLGKTPELLEHLRLVTPLSDETYERNLATLIDRWTPLIEAPEFELEPDDLALFGANEDTLVVRFHPSYELEVLHEEAYAALEAFLYECGVRDPLGFIREDERLLHSPDLSPHITLAHGCGTIPPEPPLLPVVLAPMPLVYGLTRDA